MKIDLINESYQMFMLNALLRQKFDNATYPKICQLYIQQITFFVILKGYLFVIYVQTKVMYCF